MSSLVFVFQTFDSLGWLINVQFQLSHLAINFFQPRNGLPTVYLFMLACSFAVCTKCHSNANLNTHTHRHTVSLPVYINLIPDTFSVFFCWLMKLFVLVFLQENQKARYQEWRPAHSVFRSAAARSLNKKRFYCDSFISWQPKLLFQFGVILVYFIFLMVWE